MVLFSAYIPGTLLVVAGFLVARYPWMINTIPKKLQDKMDMFAVGRMARKWLIGMGICQMVGTYLFTVSGTPIVIKTVFDVLLVMTGVIIIVVKVQKYMP